jgi:hypothetical protein
MQQKDHLPARSEGNPRPFRRTFCLPVFIVKTGAR